MISQKALDLFDRAPEYIKQFNSYGLHYNLVADGVYRELRRSKAPFSEAYEPYIVAALTSFDMARMMGSRDKKYNLGFGGFASRLHTKLTQIRSYIEPMLGLSLVEANVEESASDIVAAYDHLASGGPDGLNDIAGDQFHVGATKILHFINPELFIIVDRNAARLLREDFGVYRREGATPGYCSERYIQSLQAVKELVTHYGEERFRRLENGTPLTRIFDKIPSASGNPSGREAAAF